MFAKAFLVFMNLLGNEQAAGQTGQAKVSQLRAVPAQVRVATRLDANSVVGKVQDFYASTKSYKATFRQSVTNATFSARKPKVSDGYVYIKKPGKMRWDYYVTTRDSKKAMSRSFISNGEHLWAVLVNQKQYYKANLKDDTLPVAVSFLMGTGDLRTEFDIELDNSAKYGSKSDYVLMLTPKKPSARYKKLWLIVDGENFRVKQSVVLNIKGDLNQFRFFEPKINPPLKDGDFIFNEKAHRDFRKIEAPPQSDE